MIVLSQFRSVYIRDKDEKLISNHQQSGLWQRAGLKITELCVAK